MPFCSPQFDDIDRQWTCMVPSMGAIHGCGIGCFSCVGAQSPISAGTDIHATRWLRPSDTRESRWGNGTWKFPRAGDPYQVAFMMPIDSGNMHLASCWRNLGKERFKEGNNVISICDCAAGDHQCADVAGFYLQGAHEDPELATCWVFTGWGWLPAVFHCTGESTIDGPIPVKFRAPGLWNAALIHLGSRGEAGGTLSNSCTCNAAVDAWGFREEGGCLGSSSGYYNNVRDAYNFMFVDNFDMTWAGNRPEEALKNAIVAEFKDDRDNNNGFTYGFGQIDSERRLAGPGENKNDSLPRYGRSWNVGVITEHIDNIAFAVDTGVIRPFGLTYYPNENPYVHPPFTENIPTRAVTDVTINISGLFWRPFAFYDIDASINGVGLGHILPAAESCLPSTHTIVIDMDQWNDVYMAGNATQISIEIRAIGFFGDECVDQGLGAEEQARIQMDINYVGEFTVEGPRPFDSLPAVATLTGRFQKTGLTVTAEYVAVSGQLDANIVLHRQNRTDFGLNGPGAALNHVAPLLSVRFKAQGAVRMSESDINDFNSAGHTVNGVALQISSDYPNTLVPVVQGGVDILHWYDSQGRFVRPPRNMEWHGRLGYLSEPATLGTGQALGCDFIFSGLVPADLSHRLDDPGNRKRVWTGNCGLRHSGQGC